MTEQQIDLLKRCIRAARQAQQPDTVTDIHNYELVEVGWINGVNPRTAKSLVDAGLLVEDMPTWASEYTGTHVRLPRLNELQQMEQDARVEATAVESP